MGRLRDRFTGENASPTVAESTFRILMNDRAARIEEQQFIGGCEHKSVSVISGDSAWVKSSQHKEVIRIVDSRTIHPMWDTERLFRPQHQHDITEGLVMREAGSVQIAGRECVCFHGVWGGEAILWPHFLPFNADSYEICVDLERGAFLSIVGYLADEAFERIDVRDIIYDGEFDPSLFELRPEPGQLVERIEREPPWGRDFEPGHIEFPLFVPDQTMMKHLSLEHCRWVTEAQRFVVRLLYKTRPELGLVWIDERDVDSDHSEYEWESVTFDGLDCLISEPECAEGMRILLMRKDATRIEIYSHKPIDWIARLAKSLVPFVDTRPFPF